MQEKKQLFFEKIQNIQIFKYSNTTRRFFDGKLEMDFKVLRMQFYLLIELLYIIIYNNL